MSVRDYVAEVLQRALTDEERGDPTTAAAAWTGLSAQAFARDWASDEDHVYARADDQRA